MSGQLTTKSIYLVQRLMEKYRERKRDIHMVFIDLGKDHKKVLRDVLWRCFDAKGSPMDYIKVIKDMYDRAKTRVRIMGGDKENFLFALVIDDLTWYIQKELPWCGNLAIYTYVGDVEIEWDDVSKRETISDVLRGRGQRPVNFALIKDDVDRDGLGAIGATGAIVLPTLPKGVKFTITSTMLQMLNLKGLFRGGVSDDAKQHLMNFIAIYKSSEIPGVSQSTI
ncbi:uncharacterized protein LOC129875673 [Solanum dulcamara]|uniref:uncharacterized protein LOC129875673 n=1 Tax=Solanum dulcamara TaxID=45834 RepID=UPI0024867F87|nr:uncharacterized protein LOC129875673 [Solanum dulcamara]